MIPFNHCHCTTKTVQLRCGVLAHSKFGARLPHVRFQFGQKVSDNGIFNIHVTLAPKLLDEERIALYRSHGIRQRIGARILPLTIFSLIYALLLGSNQD